MRRRGPWEVVEALAGLLVQLAEGDGVQWAVLDAGEHPAAEGVVGAELGLGLGLLVPPGYGARGCRPTKAANGRAVSAARQFQGRRLLMDRGGATPPREPRVARAARNEAGG